MLISTGRRRGDLVIAIFPIGQRLVGVIRWIGRTAVLVKRGLGKLTANPFSGSGVRPVSGVIHAQH
jgi:hypothetical protein